MNIRIVLLLNGLAAAALFCHQAAAAPAPEGEALKAGEREAIQVRLKLIDVESRRLMDYYEKEFQRTIDLPGAVEACKRNNDDRLPEYLRALKESEQAVVDTKKKLVELELERSKLIGRLGKKEADVVAAQNEKAEQMRTLDKILELLGSIDKHLEKLERKR